MDPGTKYGEPRFVEKRQYADGRVVNVFTVEDQYGTLQIQCNICDVKINGRKNFEKHADGKKHLNKIAKVPLFTETVESTEDDTLDQFSDQSKKESRWGPLVPISNTPQEIEEIFRPENLIPRQHEVYTPQYKAPSPQSDTLSKVQKQSTHAWDPDDQLLAHISSLKNWPKELPSKKQLMKSHDIGYTLHREYFDAPKVQPEIQRVCRTSEMCDILDSIHNYALQVAKVNLHSLQEVAVLKSPGKPYTDLSREHALLQSHGYQVLNTKQLTEIVQYMWNTQYMLAWLSKDLGEARRKLYLDLCPENKLVLSKLDMTHDWLFGSEAVEKIKEAESGQERKKQKR